MPTQPAITEAQEAAAVSYDTADPAAVNAARKREARLHRGRLDFVAGVMSLKEGRAWMYDTLEKCHIFHTSFVQGDPYATAFKCGEHNQGLRMLAEVMAAAPDQYVVMCQEGSARV